MAGRGSARLMAMAGRGEANQGEAGLGLASRGQSRQGQARFGREIRARQGLCG